MFKQIISRDSLSLWTGFTPGTNFLAVGFTPTTLRRGQTLVHLHNTCTGLFYCSKVVNIDLKRIERRKSPPLPKGNTIYNIIKPVEIPQWKGEKQVTVELDSEKLKSVLKRMRKSLIIRKALTVETSMHSDIMDRFHEYCIDNINSLPDDLHRQLDDFIRKKQKISTLVPVIIKYAHQIYPQLDVMKELKHLCKSPMADPVNWFPRTREMKRKIIYHCGPTNSGKTYMALNSFMKAETGVYLAPLRLLAMEVFTNTNAKEIPCDMFTGETRYKVLGEHKNANHRACTTEMLEFPAQYKVAVIDEIQMIADSNRGGAWTAALLGVRAEEVHVCGNSSVLDVVKKLVEMCGDSFEVKFYERKGPLVIEDKPLDKKFKNVQAGDCIVCFKIQDVFKIMERLKRLGHNCALIYGALSSGIKRHQTELFNDPDSDCNVLVATDAIGLGLNLQIKRIIFHEMVKINQDLTPSEVVQIAGRAGRYGKLFEESGGAVTAYGPSNFRKLKKIFKEPISDIQKVGLFARDDVLETFAFYLPGVPFSEVMMLYVAMIETDDQYFVCDTESRIRMARLIDDIQLVVRDKITFTKVPFKQIRLTKSCTVYKLMARHVAEGKPMTLEIFLRACDVQDLDVINKDNFADALSVFNLADIYLWLSQYFKEFNEEFNMKAFCMILEKSLKTYLETNFSRDDRKHIKKLKRLLFNNNVISEWNRSPELSYLRTLYKHDNADINRIIDMCKNDFGMEKFAAAWHADLTNKNVMGENIGVTEVDVGGVGLSKIKPDSNLKGGKESDPQTALTTKWNIRPTFSHSPSNRMEGFRLFLKERDLDYSTGGKLWSKLSQEERDRYVAALNT